MLPNSMHCARSPCAAQVTEHARARGETAIGWLSGDGPLHLAPPALERNTYKDGDRIIVVGCPLQGLDAVSLDAPGAIALLSVALCASFS